MRKLEKKLFVIFLSLAFLTSGLAMSTAIPYQKFQKNEQEEISSAQLLETVTIYRCGIDGVITTVEVEIELEEEQDINVAITDKCEELFEMDTEFQSFSNDNASMDLLSFVKSRGRGIHIKLLPRIRLIFCIYSGDQKAFTSINPLIGGNTTVIEGPHMVFAVGFYGFKWWRGHVSLLGFVIRTGFVGFSLFTNVNKL